MFDTFFFTVQYKPSYAMFRMETEGMDDGQFNARLTKNALSERKEV